MITRGLTLPRLRAVRDAVSHLPDDRNESHAESHRRSVNLDSVKEVSEDPPTLMVRSRHYKESLRWQRMRPLLRVKLLFRV